jgi:hypothetical protein
MQGPAVGMGSHTHRRPTAARSDSAIRARSTFCTQVLRGLRHHISSPLTVTHDQLREGANEELYGGWPMILSVLKTWLETGEVLTTPGSLMYT